MELAGIDRSQWTSIISELRLLAISIGGEFVEDGRIQCYLHHLVLSCEELDIPIDPDDDYTSLIKRYEDPRKAAAELTEAVLNRRNDPDKVRHVQAVLGRVNYGVEATYFAHWGCDLPPGHREILRCMSVRQRWTAASTAGSVVVPGTTGGSAGKGI